MKVVAFILFAAAALPKGTQIDRVILVVDKEVVTYSELLVETRISLLLQQGEQSATADLTYEIVNAFRELLINQMLIATQARRVGTFDVSEEDVEVELDAFARRFRSPDAYLAFLRRFDISDVTLKNILRRNLRNERYIQQRWRTRQKRDTDSSDQGDLQKHLAEWLVDLRQSVEIRYVGNSKE